MLVLPNCVYVGVAKIDLFMRVFIMVHYKTCSGNVNISQLNNIGSHAK